MNRKRILFFLHAFIGGGSERVATLLLEHLDRQKFEPLVVLYKGGSYYPMPPEDVPITCLHKKSRYDLPRLIWQLARVYEKEKPDTVLSFGNYPNLIAILARKLSRIKPRLLFSEHSHTSTGFKYEPLSRFKAWVIPHLYPQADAVICVSRGVADDLVTQFEVPRQKIKVIYNPVDIEYVSSLAQEAVDHAWFAQKENPIIIAMGHLIARKGYNYLLKAFAQVITKFPCRLVILGEGEERAALENLVRQLGIEGQVDFFGFPQNPFKYLARSDIFVLSSLWEGFAMVIMEAMACGTPVISTRCPSGPDEIITDGVNGLLVPVADETALVEAVLRLLNDPSFARKLAQAGRKRAEDFVVTKIVKEYEALL